MYIPNHFKAKPDDSIVEFIQTYPFGVLVAAVNHRNVASHLPFVIKQVGDKYLLSSHLSAVNELHQTFQEQEVLLIDLINRC